MYLSIILIIVFAIAIYLSFDSLAVLGPNNVSLNPIRNNENYTELIEYLTQHKDLTKNYGAEAKKLDSSPYNVTGKRIGEQVEMIYTFPLIKNI